MPTSNWKRRLLAMAVFCGASLAAAAYLLNDYATPFVRENIDHPLYTVGDENYEAALADNKKIVKFGPLPFSIYSGGVAFSNPADAREHLVALGKEETWDVYVLSGDFELDSSPRDDGRYTNKSLLVIEKATKAEPKPDYLSLDYQAFDQTPDSGWRVAAAEGKYANAADMLDTYCSSIDELTEQQKRILNFHSGQMHAYAGNYPDAIERLQLSMTEEEVNSPIEWNAYVRATIAFLNDDQEELKRCRDKIAAGPQIQGMVPNLDVVESLIANLGEPYSRAYESHRGMSQR